jgi:hypothetical protein
MSEGWSERWNFSIANVIPDATASQVCDQGKAWRVCEPSFGMADCQISRFNDDSGTLRTAKWQRRAFMLSSELWDNVCYGIDLRALT